MSTIVSRLDIIQIFCDVDDFCNQWDSLWQQVPQLPSTKGERRSQCKMHLSEVMTIARVLRTRCANAFHGSGYKTFKEFYTLHVLPGWRGAFPNLVSYTRFVLTAYTYLPKKPKIDIYPKDLPALPPAVF